MEFIIIINKIKVMSEVDIADFLTFSKMHDWTVGSSPIRWMV